MNALSTYSPLNIFLLCAFSPKPDECLLYFRYYLSVRDTIVNNIDIITVRKKSLEIGQVAIKCSKYSNKIKNKNLRQI